MLYKSTRGDGEKISSSEAILRGLAQDGGLYVPEFIPGLEIQLTDLAKMNFQQCAYEIMKMFLTDFTEEELKDCIAKAYDCQFDTEHIVPLSKVNEEYYMELFHGPTIAFKDIALSILPHLMKTAAENKGQKEEILILTATSGDTGKAAMEGFRDVEGMRIIVFYPRDGVSDIQRLQMVTQRGENVSVVAIEGNFDEAQTGVKNIFLADDMKQELRERGYRMSSANSINIGRLIPQVVYYAYAYGKLIENKEILPGEAINVVVPTGNFGNILAAHYSRRMGIPIAKLICASNENKVLYDFFSTGVYDRNREFQVTNSPSMDILISSNLERLIFELTNEDCGKTRMFMDALIKEGRYVLTREMMEKTESFYSGYATEEETLDFIRERFLETGYLMDTHTAVAGCVLKKYREDTGDLRKSVIASTASPFKFPDSVLEAIDRDYVTAGQGNTHREKIEHLSEICHDPVPEAIALLWDLEVRHHISCAPEQMSSVIRKLS